MDVEQWMDARGGIVHRHVARDARVPERDLRAAVRSGALRVVRRAWFATSAAPPDLLAAAKVGGRIACLTVARDRGWWMPEGLDARRHVHVAPGARGDGPQGDDVIHWTKPVAPASAHSLRESVEDALAHIARCAPREAALVLWESAVRTENLSVEALKQVRWHTRVARELAHEVTGLSDSGLETLFRARLGPWGLPVRQQVMLAARPVDILIGDYLVVQVDGHAFHSTAAERARDARHDAELRLRGYTVLRVTYAQVLHDWPAVERLIARAVAAGLHVAPAR